MKNKPEMLSRYLCEVEVTEGLETITIDEITERFGKAVEILSSEKPGEIRFYYKGGLGRLRSLQTAYAVYIVYSYDVPRPRGLLGDAHFRRLLEQIDLVRGLSPNAYHTFSIAAAGSDSTVMNRIKEDIVTRAGLTLAADKGDMHIRIRPHNDMWQTLIRLSPRPLVTRSWRVCNMEGALNAATAHAMIRMVKPDGSDVFLNLGCGSGTLLIERLSFGASQQVIGVDRSIDALTCAETNIRAAGEELVTLLCADMTKLPLSSASIDQVAADLPFGQLMGSHNKNVVLYPQVLRETARVTRPRGQFTLITHEIRLMDRLLRESRIWHVEQSIQVNLRGLHPRIYVLRRTVNAL